MNVTFLTEIRLDSVMTRRMTCREVSRSFLTHCTANKVCICANSTLTATLGVGGEQILGRELSD